MKKMRQFGQETDNKVVTKAIKGIKAGANKLLKGLGITGALVLGGTAIANTNADNIFANFDAPKIEQKVEKHPSEALTTEIEQTDPKTKDLSEGGGDGDDGDPHEKLLKTNPTYKANYTRAMDLFNAGAGKICSKIAAKRKLTTNESNAFLMVFYLIWQDDLNDGIYQTTKDKKSILGLYFDDVSWNNAASGKINTAFAAFIRKAKNMMKTNPNLKDTPMPILPEKAVDVSEL